MARNDGRIEKGQRLSSAISARAWNRAQQAADIVLGVEPSVSATAGSVEPRRVVVPCLVSSSKNDITVGHVVKITACSAYDIPDGTHAQRCAAAHSLTGEIIEPVSLANYGKAKVQLGVIVSGVTMPKSGTPAIVNVCIAGMCVARVRPRDAVASDGWQERQFIQGPVVRSGDSETSLRGVAEACSCGHQRIIQFIGDADSVSKFAVVLL
jgi:hypothetical protein